MNRPHSRPSANTTSGSISAGAREADSRCLTYEVFHPTSDAPRRSLSVRSHVSYPSLKFGHDPVWYTSSGGDRAVKLGEGNRTMLMPGEHSVLRIHWRCSTRYECGILAMVGAVILCAHWGLYPPLLLSLSSNSCRQHVLWISSESCRKYICTYEYVLG